MSDVSLFCVCSKTCAFGHTSWVKGAPNERRSDGRPPAQPSQRRPPLRPQQRGSARGARKTPTRSTNHVHTRCACASAAGVATPRSGHGARASRAAAPCPPVTRGARRRRTGTRRGATRRRAAPPPGRPPSPRRAAGRPPRRPRRGGSGSSGGTMRLWPRKSRMPRLEVDEACDSAGRGLLRMGGGARRRRKEGARGRRMRRLEGRGPQSVCGSQIGSAVFWKKTILRNAKNNNNEDEKERKSCGAPAGGNGNPIKTRKRHWKLATEYGNVHTCTCT